MRCFARWIVSASFVALTTEFLSSCVNKPTDDFERSIFDWIHNNCAADPCYVNLDGVTPFDWDLLYVFDYSRLRRRLKGFSIGS